MSYDIHTGALRSLADAKPHMTDDEYRRESGELLATLAQVNDLLAAHGLTAHAEPGPDDIRAYVWTIKRTYGALIGFVADVEARSDYRFPQLLSSAGGDWVFVPADFAEPLHTVNDDLVVASAYELYRECSTLAVLLGLRGTVDDAPESSDPVDAEYRERTGELDRLTGFDARTVRPIEGLEIPARTDGPTAFTDLEAGCDTFLTAARISLAQRTALFVA